MIICLSGFVITGTSPTSMPIGARNDISVMDRVSMSGVGACVGPALGVGARYSPHHHQLLAALGAGGALRGGGPRSSSSSAESVSSHSASPPPPAASLRPFNFRYTRVRTLYACLGESDGELSFEPNQIITNVSASGEPGWLRGSLNGKTGLVPENYVEPLP